MFCHYFTFLEIEDSQIWIEMLPNVRIRHVDNKMIKVKRKKLSNGMLARVINRSRVTRSYS